MLAHPGGIQTRGSVSPVRSPGRETLPLSPLLGFSPALGPLCSSVLADILRSLLGRVFPVMGPGAAGLIWAPHLPLPFCGAAEELLS